MREEIIYAAAMKEINVLVDSVMKQICLIADCHNYDNEWMANQFKTKFNKKAKELK